MSEKEAFWLQVYPLPSLGRRRSSPMRVKKTTWKSLQARAERHRVPANYLLGKVITAYAARAQSLPEKESGLDARDATIVYIEKGAADEAKRRFDEVWWGVECSIQWFLSECTIKEFHRERTDKTVTII